MSGLVVSPRDPTPHHHLGQLLLEQSRLAEASQHFLAGRARVPAIPVSISTSASCSWQARATAEARPHFQRALQCDPTNAEAHHGLGRVLMDEGRLDEAEASFRRRCGSTRRLHAPGARSPAFKPNAVISSSPASRPARHSQSARKWWKPTCGWQSTRAAAWPIPKSRPLSG